MKIYNQVTAWRNRRRQSTIARLNEDLALLGTVACDLQDEVQQAWAEREQVQRELDQVRQSGEFLRQANVHNTALIADLKATVIRIGIQRDAALTDLKNMRRVDVGLSAADLDFIAENRAIDRMADV